MKIVVYPHDLGVGGSQLNAIEIAAAVQRSGHEVIVFGQPGALNRRIEELGLEFVPAPTPHRRPSPSVIRAIVELIRVRGIDVVHAYEWPPALESRLASLREPSATSVATVMSMAVAPFIPKAMPLLVGTQEILEAEQMFGRLMVELLEPPVDVEFNSPDAAVSASDFRGAWDLDPGAFTVVLVTRLAQELKFEGVLAAMDAVQALSAELRIQLVVVGDGPAREVVKARAWAVNAACGRRAVILTGQLADPRPAYAAADTALGMGGSALRALAFAKPLVVQGEHGFWELLTPVSLPVFLHQGWYGVGTGTEGGAEKLAGILRGLAHDDNRRTQLGLFGLRMVRERFSLVRAAEIQENFYERALLKTNRLGFPESAAALRHFARYHGLRQLHRAMGHSPTDDFNARPVAARKPQETLPPTVLQPGSGP